MKVYVAIRDIGKTDATSTVRDVLGVFTSKELARAHIWKCSTHLRSEETPVQPGSYADHGDYISGAVNGWWHEYFYKPFETDKPVEKEE